MKIAIIGIGTSAIITALNFLKRGHEVSFYYDPNISPISVGESSTPHIIKLLKIIDVGIDDLVGNDIASIKKGVNFIGWGKKLNFIHPFTDDDTAVHFQTNIFNDYIHNIFREKYNIKYYPVNVTDSDYYFTTKQVKIHSNEYDFVVECSGWYSEHGYCEANFKTVDTAILFTKNEIENQNYTIHRATEDGWQFELPFPNNSISKCGYLFNSEFIDQEKINNLQNTFKSNKIIKWTPRYAKKILREPRIGMNGNKLFFFEPLQALSLLYYHINAEYLCEYLEDRNKINFSDTNYKYLNSITEYQKILAFHYRFKSIYDTLYWNKISEKADMISKCFSNIADVDALIYSFKNDLFFKENFDIINNFSSIGCMQLYDIKALLSGFLNLSEDCLNNYENIFSEF